MDHATSAFYARYAQGTAVRAEAPHSAISAYFDRAFKAGGKILDIGAGSGRDMAFLLEMGFDAYGIEPNDAMRTFAARAHSELAARLAPGALPLVDAPFGASFDGVVCSAVLMHVPPEQLALALRSIRDVLAPGGRVLIALPSMRAGLLDNDRDRDGRYFQNHPVAGVTAAAQACGLAQIALDADSVTTLPDVTWTILLFEVASFSRCGTSNALW